MPQRRLLVVANAATEPPAIKHEKLILDLYYEWQMIFSANMKTLVKRHWHHLRDKISQSIFPQWVRTFVPFSKGRVVVGFEFATALTWVFVSF